MTLKTEAIISMLRNETKQKRRVPNVPGFEPNDLPWENRVGALFRFFCLPIVTCWLTEPYDLLVWLVQKTRES